MKIASKIKLSFFIMTVAITGITISIFYLISKKNLKDEIYGHLETTTQLRANDIEFRLKEYRQAIQVISTDDIFVEFLSMSRNNPEYDEKTELTSGKMKGLLKYYPEVEGFYLLDKEGIVVASTEKKFIGRKESNFKLYSEGKKKTYIQDVHISPLFGGSAIVVATPLLFNGQFRGVILADVDVIHACQILPIRTDLSKTEEIYLINKDGYIIFTSRFSEGELLTQKIDNLNSRSCFRRTGKEPLKSKIIDTYSNYLGADVIGTHAFIPEMKWCLIGEIDKSEVLTPLIRLKTFFIFLLLLAPLPAWVIAASISGVITRPIQSLRKGVEFIGRRDMDHKVGTKSDDEIGELSRAFDTMSSELNVSYSSLEMKVEEKTKELFELLKKTERERAYLEENKKALLNIMDDLESRQKELVVEISRREQAEQNLKKTAERLLSSNKQLEEFAYIASHDLQEPLRKVSTFVDRLRDKHSHALDEKGLDYLERMQNAVIRMKELINDLLSYSRISSVEEILEPVNLSDIIRKIVSDIVPEEKEDMVTIEVEDLITIISSPFQMRQLFQNLIGNALKFGKKGEKLSIKVFGEEIDGFYRITVQDNGIGFEEKYSERIFSIFQRLHGKTEYQGTGIGLAVCKKIVEHHYGRIRAKSKLGEGASFIVELPIKATNMS